MKWCEFLQMSDNQLIQLIPHGNNYYAFICEKNGNRALCIVPFKYFKKKFNGFYDVTFYNKSLIIAYLDDEKNTVAFEVDVKII